MDEVKDPRPKRFKVAEIAVDEDGMLWLHYVGTQPEQGGFSYGWGSVGVHDPVSLGKLVQSVIEVESPEYLRRIKSSPKADRS